TTGIYCLPSCRVRKPLPQNVVYLADAAAAREAGYRACLRCHPDAGSPVSLHRIDTPIGPLLLGATSAAVVLCDFAERPMIDAQLASVRRRIGPTRMGDGALIDRLERHLREFLAGERHDFDLPLDAPGSAFQERVWGELRAIPYGETISYRELAARVGVPAASRAVGRANGSNRLAIIIPCHRVIAANGGLGGYGGGLPAKEALLALEARASVEGVRLS
ncbi:MAG: methylated-DNA--[protein]-cysteine S-methyltransferase, partial [Candidatus Limnocylindria bacterium]